MLEDFTKEQEIKWEPTAPHSQNQDGVAERSIRTIISRARTSLLAAPNLPKSLWAEGVATTIYLTNRSPTKALPKGKTPHEMLHGSKPSYRHLRTFGCAAYALKLNAKQEGKMAPRSEKVWLLGYEASTIFRVWDPKKKLVRTTKNVVFNEAELAAYEQAEVEQSTPSPNAEAKEANTQSNADSEGESVARIPLRPTTRSMTRKSKASAAVGVSKPDGTMDLAIVLPERDPETEEEGWTTEVANPAVAMYAIIPRCSVCPIDGYQHSRWSVSERQRPQPIDVSKP